MPRTNQLRGWNPHPQNHQSSTVIEEVRNGPPCRTFLFLFVFIFYFWLCSSAPSQKIVGQIRGVVGFGGTLTWAPSGSCPQFENRSYATGCQEGSAKRRGGSKARQRRRTYWAGRGVGEGPEAGGRGTKRRSGDPS